MSRHLIVLAALFLASTPLAAAAQTPPPTAPATAGVEVTEADREGFRDGLKAAGAGETFDLVRKHFPEDYAAFAGAAFARMADYPTAYCTEADVAEAAYAAATEDGPRLRYPAGADTKMLAELRWSTSEDHYLARMRAMFAP